MSTTGPRVVIVGGGIAGATLAHATSQILTDVTLLEGRSLAAGSTGLSAGGFRHQFSDPTDIGWAERSVEVITSVARRSLHDLGVVRNGYLFVASEEATADLLKESVRMQNSLGVPTRWMSPGEIADRVGELHVDDLIGGSYCRGDGWLDPAALVTELTDLAKSNGVSYRQGFRVAGAELSSGVWQVESASGEVVRGDVLVNCAGPWAPSLPGFEQWDLPIRSWRAQSFRVVLDSLMVDRWPMIIDYDAARVYAHPVETNSLVVGNDAFGPEDVAYDPSCRWDAVVPIVEALSRRIPSTGTAGMVAGGWAGFLDITPDERPLVGWLDEASYSFAGFSGHGISLAPGLATVVAQELAKGVSVDATSTYSPLRSVRAKGVAERLTMH